MDATLIIHILGGTGGLLAGYLALFSRKGKTLHRRAGLVFVVSMLTMCAAGLIVTLSRNVAVQINAPASVLTAALVVSALTTVRERTRAVLAAELAATVAMIGVTAACIILGLDAIAGSRTYAGYAFPFVMFSVAGGFGSIGDIRMWRSGRPTGARRIARHLWRMCFALFIAAMSFFLGQASVIPEPLRIKPLLAAAPLTVLVLMTWWLIKLKRRRTSIEPSSRTAAPSSSASPVPR